MEEKVNFIAQLVCKYNLKTFYAYFHLFLIFFIFYWGSIINLLLVREMIWVQTVNKNFLYNFLWKIVSLNKVLQLLSEFNTLSINIYF